MISQTKKKLAEKLCDLPPTTVECLFRNACPNGITAWPIQPTTPEPRNP